MNNRSLPILISIFFFWGFVAASNDILIPVFKEKLHLAQWQSQMISFAFYVAYTVGSIIYYLVSKLTKQDLLNRIGYKNGLSLGLVISAIGTLLFYPAAQTASFPLMISGLFIVGLGFSLQQTAANPLAIVMGDPSNGSQRLSLAGGVNNIGTTIGPLLISFAIFGSIASSSSGADIESVKTPYLILGAAFIIMAIVFKFSNIPNTIPLNNNSSATSKTAYLDRKSALKYPQLVLGMIAIFVYVGVEVSTGGNLGEFMKQHLQVKDGNFITKFNNTLSAGATEFTTKMNAPFISLFWASLMIGRWTSSVGIFNLKGGAKHIFKFLMPYIAFSFFLLVNKIANHDIIPFYIYALVIIALIIGDMLSKGNPARQLLLYSLFGIVALFVGMLANGLVSVFAFISVGLFCSTLWPCIFTLAIKGLGKHTNQGSGFIIMMIMGGGFISLLQGALADSNLGIQWSYLVGVACFAYLAFYAIVVKKILKKQSIEI